MVRLSSLNFLLVVVACQAFAQNNLGIFQDHSDVGAVSRPGAANFIAATNQYVISGAGYNIWGDHDEFHFLWKKMKGDFILYTRASFVGAKGVEEHRKIGWMVRKTLEGNSPHVNATVHGDGLTSLQFRKSPGAATEEQKSKITHADIIQLERRGNVYTMRAAVYGEPYTVDSLSGVDLGDEVYVGLFVGSHNADVTETGVFRDVKISVPAWNGLVPYRDYLGSEIEILDLASGARQVVHTSSKSLQAPNWTPDGKSLIYNSGGLIYRLDLTDKKESVINTDTVKNNNNDHVLSFDGKMLGLSSGVRQLGGSIVYTVPFTGGSPKQITPIGPSYLHSWSPDGKLLLFTGQRNGDFDIYRVPSAGGRELRLTTAVGLDDGPEYSRDGKYIYFNSNQSGNMQIWRMTADGSEQQAMTNDEFHDWFPHPSPDGKWIVFISFLKNEVNNSDHPFYKHVYLRLMPVAGGKPTVVAYLYGGQGTINTPSWSPDSKKLAFVSNSGGL